MMGSLLALLTSGAGGGIVGGTLALFRTAGERKERLELERLSLERDRLEVADKRAVESHEKEMLEAGAEINLRQAQTEGDIAADIANQQNQAIAQQAEFGNLKTSTWVDNLRASIRPSLAIWFTALFSTALVWAFWTYRDQLSAGDGKEILLGLFATMEFAVTSVIAFYYVSRQNSAAA